MSTTEQQQQTHREFAASDTSFRAACERASVEPTRRQASKFRNKRGRAYAARREV